MSDQSKLGLGQIITTEQQRDAIHIAVAPVTAGESLTPGAHVGIADDDTAKRMGIKSVGIVDPFLREQIVEKGEKFWLYLYPGSITSLRHEWTHPALPAKEVAAKSSSEAWMRAWAATHMSAEFYGDERTRDPEIAYQDAIRAGHDMNVGPYEDARDHIDGEWWNHWENITGTKGERDEYFSCSC